MAWACAQKPIKTKGQMGKVIKMEGTDRLRGTELTLNSLALRHCFSSGTEKVASVDSGLPLSASG